LSFIFWGVGTVDKTGVVETAAEVGKYKITAEDYWKNYDRTSQFYRELYKDAFNEEMEKKLNLKENVLASMVNEKVLLIAAKETGISVSDQELQDAISHEPAFMNNGVFDKDLYLNRLRLNRLTPEEFESATRQELTVTKMRQLIELSVDPTDIDPPAKQTSGNEQAAKMINEAVLRDKKEKAVNSYIEGLKKNIKIKINTKLIT
jgi:peptidyl-prolyl cis-trans isomerase D